MTRKLWVAMALFVPLAATLALAQPSASFGAAKRLLAGTLELERGDPHSGLSTRPGRPQCRPSGAAPSTM